MSERDDGGPAFPSVMDSYGTGQTEFATRGMTLRDYFAIHAPSPEPWWLELNRQRDRSRNPHNDSYKPPIRSEMELNTSWRYEYADAMLAARGAK